MFAHSSATRVRLACTVAAAVLFVFSGVNVARAQPPQPQSQSPIDYATARLGRTLSAVKATGPIALDGSFDEPSWRDAPVANGFVQNEPREGQPATFDTDVRVLYDEQALYLGVFAHDDTPDAIIVSDLKKDFNTGASDTFFVVIDTFSDERNGFEFATNPAGAKWDAQMANEGREINANWDGIWDVRTRMWRAAISRPPARRRRRRSRRSRTSTPRSPASRRVLRPPRAFPSAPSGCVRPCSRCAPA